MSKSLNAFFSFLFILSGTLSWAQSGTVSPYSRFGLGNLNSQTSSAEFAMGGLGMGFVDSTRIHSFNPAGIANINRTIYQFGVYGEVVQLRNQSATEYQNTSNLNYLALGFPITKKWKTAMGVKPFSSSGYELNDREEIDSIGGVNYNYLGSGGINQVFWTNSIQPIKNLSIGITAFYQFGSLDRELTVRFDSTDHHNVYRRNRTHLSDLGYELGLQYQFRGPLNGDWVFAAQYSPSLNLRANKEVLVYTFTDFSGFVSNKDTLQNNSSSGEVQLPSGWSVALSRSQGTQWMWGAQFQTKNWSEYSNFGARDSLGASFRFSTGASFTPNHRAITSYLARVNYRAGFYFGQTHLNLRNQALSDIGISFGVGLPLRSSRQNVSEINLGVAFGKMGTTDQSLIQENYFRFKLGLVLNDKWFIKRRIN